MATKYEIDMSRAMGEVESEVKRFVQYYLQDATSDMQRTVSDGGNMPVRTGVLRSSFTSYINGGIAGQGTDSAIVALTGFDLGDVLKFGWGGPAKGYAGYVHDGTSRMAGRFWMTTVLANSNFYAEQAAQRVGWK